MKKTLILLTLITSVFFLVPGNLYSQAGTAINFQNANFNSHGDFIYCGAPNYGFTDQLTVAVWIKWTTDPSSWSVSNHDEREGQYSSYISYATHNTLNITTEHGQFWLRNTKVSNKFEFTVENESGTKVSVTSSTKPSTGTWYFLTGTYDGSKVRIYVNGSLENEANQSGNIRANTDCRLNMGRLPWGYGFFVGYLDEARVWDSALSLTDIQNQMSSKTTINNTNCKSYWNFDAGSGTTISDSKGLATGTFYSGLTDIHGGNVDLANKILEDADRAFVTGAWDGKTIKTVSGAGVNENNIIVSNTGNIITLTFGFGGSAPDNLTTPVIDDIANMTWFGILDPSESSQWVSSSDLTLPVNLVSFTAKSASNTIELEWNTASETDNIGFIIDRKSDDTSWQQIASYQTHAELTGQGTTSYPSQYNFTDNNISMGVDYTYRLSEVSTTGTVNVIGNTSVVASTTPQTTQLLAAYPNPFNPSTTLNYSLAKDSHVTLTVYDVLGREIKSLVNQQQIAGEHSIRWDSLTNAGTPAPSGTYLVRMQTAGYNQSQKIQLLK